MQVTQGRITGAKIIEGELNPPDTQLLQFAGDQLLVLEQHLLCDFKFEPLCRKVLFRQRLQHELNKVFLFDE